MTMQKATSTVCELKRLKLGENRQQVAFVQADKVNCLAGGTNCITYPPASSPIHDKGSGPPQILACSRNQTASTTRAGQKWVLEVFPGWLKEPQNTLIYSTGAGNTALKEIWVARMGAFTRACANGQEETRLSTC